MSLVYIHLQRMLDWRPFLPLLQMRQDLADNIGFGDEVNFISPPHLGQRSGSTSKKNGAKRPRFGAFREQLFYLEHTVEIFGDRDKLVAIGIQDRIIVILHRVNTQLVITAGL